MDDSALKVLIDCLGAHRSELVRYLNDWTWVVAIGVFFEVIFIIWDHCDDLSDWRFARTRFKIRFPSRPSRIKLGLEILSVALVVGGIIGELHVEAQLGKLDNDIQDANNQRVALLGKESSAQRLRAACLEKQLLEFQKAALFRTIDVDRVAGKLRSNKNVSIGDFWVAVRTLFEIEPQSTTRLIARAITKAGWKVGSTSGGGDGAALSHPGIWIEVVPPPLSGNGVKPLSAAEFKSQMRSLNNAARDIRTALADEGLDVTVKKLDPNDFPGIVNQWNSVQIFISVRPMPPLGEIDMSKSTDTNPCPTK